MGIMEILTYEQIPSLDRCLSYLCPSPSCEQRAEECFLWEWLTCGAVSGASRNEASTAGMWL